MLKIATSDDLPDLKRLSIELVKNSPYKTFTIDEGKIEELLIAFIDADPNIHVLLLYQEEGRAVGLLAGIAREFKFNRDKHASEIALWVEPEFRGKAGKELQEAFLFWAKKVGCKYLHMGLLEDKDLSKRQKLYKKQGFVPFEQAWVKEI